MATATEIATLRPLVHKPLCCRMSARPDGWCCTCTATPTWAAPQLARLSSPPSQVCGDDKHVGLASRIFQQNLQVMFLFARMAPLHAPTGRSVAQWKPLGSQSRRAAPSRAATLGWMRSCRCRWFTLACRCRTRWLTRRGARTAGGSRTPGAATGRARDPPMSDARCRCVGVLTVAPVPACPVGGRYRSGREACSLRPGSTPPRCARCSSDSLLNKAPRRACSTRSRRPTNPRRRPTTGAVLAHVSPTGCCRLSWSVMGVCFLREQGRAVDCRDVRRLLVVRIHRGQCRPVVVTGTIQPRHSARPP